MYYFCCYPTCNISITITTSCFIVSTSALPPPASHVVYSPSPTVSSSSPPHVVVFFFLSINYAENYMSSSNLRSVNVPSFLPQSPPHVTSAPLPLAVVSFLLTSSKRLILSFTTSHHILTSFHRSILSVIEELFPPTVKCPSQQQLCILYSFFLSCEGNINKT